MLSKLLSNSDFLKTLKDAVDDIDHIHLDGDRNYQYDYDIAIDNVEKLLRHYNDGSLLVELQDMNFYGNFHDIIDVAADVLGYKWSEHLSDMEEYKWVYVNRN